MSERNSSRSTGSDSARASPARSSVNVRTGSFGTGTSCKIIVEKSLNALVGGAEMIGEQAFLLAILRDQRGDDVAQFRAWPVSTG